jgi:hypothetical protein
LLSDDGVLVTAGSDSFSLALINGVEFTLTNDGDFCAFNCCGLGIGAVEGFVGDEGAELLDGTMVGLVLTC